MAVKRRGIWSSCFIPPLAFTLNLLPSSALSFLHVSQRYLLQWLLRPCLHDLFSHRRDAKHVLNTDQHGNPVLNLAWMIYFVDRTGPNAGRGGIMFPSLPLDYNSLCRLQSVHSGTSFMTTCAMATTYLSHKVGLGIWVWISNTQQE